MTIVCYTGIGSKIDGKHTRKEFLQIVRNHNPEIVRCRRKGVPVDEMTIKKTDLIGWMAFAGAQLTTPAQCEKIVRERFPEDAQ